MERFLQYFATQWMPTSDYIWISSIGGKIVLKDDLVICVTTLENKVMHEIAAEYLERDYKMNVAHCPDRSKIPKRNVIMKYVRHFAENLVPCLESNIVVGLSLESAYQFDSKLPDYDKLYINNEYKLHVPYFVLQSVRCIEKYGVAKPGIFARVGNLARYFELDFMLTRNNSKRYRYTFDYNDDVSEVASLLQFYLMHIPGGLFTEALEMHFVNTRELCNPRKLKALSYLVKVLPRANRETAYLVFSLLHKIAYTKGNGMNTRHLNNVFSSILFRSRYIVDNKSLGTLQFLIQNFSTIFTLEADFLQIMYYQIGATYPIKLNKHIQRRVNQCHCNQSVIPKSLIILTSKFRSYDTHKVNLYRHVNNRSGGILNAVLYQHNHKTCHSISFTQLWSHDPDQRRNPNN